MTNTTDRRKFLVGGAIAGAAVGAIGASVLQSPPKKEEAPAAPAIAKSETINLKMQSSIVEAATKHRWFYKKQSFRRDSQHWRR